MTSLQEVINGPMKGYILSDKIIIFILVKEIVIQVSSHLEPL